MECDVGLIPQDRAGTSLILAEVKAVPDSEIRQAIHVAWHAAQGRLWAVAFHLLRIESGKLYAQWSTVDGAAYRSTSEWAEAELAGMHKSTVSRLTRAGRFVLGLEDDSEREAWQELSPYRVEQVIDLAKSDRDGAYELAASPITDSQLRKSATEKTPEQHQETDWRTYKVQYPASLDEVLNCALNMARYHCAKTDPQPCDLLEWMITVALLENVGEKWEPHRNAILSGEAKCKLWGTDLAAKGCCGWNAQALDGHHVLPRSRGGHDEAVIWICRPCHDHWQPRSRELAAKLGMADLVERWEDYGKGQSA